MDAAFKEAITGKTERFFSLLTVASGLPGTRANLPLAMAFATECVNAGKASDKLVERMATYSADEAPGDSPLEFLPLCGVLALGARAAKEPARRKRTIAALHELSDDLRFRVRDAVPMALARIGAEMGDALVHEVASWTDGFFQATAVLLALSDTQWLSRIEDVEAALSRLDEAYALARDAPRSAARWPGRKALVEAIGTAPAFVAARFGMPVFDRMIAWSKVEQPELRQAIEKNLHVRAIASRYPNDVARVMYALDASAPVPRDPTILVQGMRGRGKKAKRR